MAKGNVQFSNDNEYYTPKEVLNYFGEFDYDPATVREKALEFNIFVYDTIETDGLKRDWSIFPRIWINPPFTEKHKFLAKAVETYKQAKNEIYMLFPIEFITTKRFHDIMGDIGGELFIPSGRICFQSGLGKPSKSAAFGSVVMKLSDSWKINLIDIKELKEHDTN